MPQNADAEKESAVTANIFAQPLSIFGMPVDRETIFSNHKKIYKPRVEKRQRNLIVKATSLKFYLHPQECIRCLTTGYSPIRIVEQALTGPAFLFFKRAIFVFTDQRILHVRTSFSRKTRHSVSQILYEDCSAILMKGRSLIVCYKGGKQEVFNYIGLREKKKIKSLLDELQLKPKDPAVFSSRVALCPSCASVLKKRNSQCEACKLKFKSSRAAMWLSLVLPGGGYFYCNHTLLGTAVAVVEVAAIGLLIFQWLDYRNGLALQWGLLLLAAGVLILEKTVATFHSVQMTQDNIPKAQDFETPRV